MYIMCANIYKIAIIRKLACISTILMDYILSALKK